MFKHLALELGGKNPTIVFADADFENAVATSVRAAFANQGEICLCGSRLFVEESIHDRFVEAFIARAKQLKQGDPLDESTQQGALVSRQHMKKITDAIAQAKQEGGTIAAGGGPGSVPGRCANGYFVQPTVITGLAASCRTCQEEIFGPVVTITPFRNEDEVVEQVNSVRYGLSSSLWTSDLSRAHRLAERIEAGTVWINCWLLRDLRVPFGGTKDSGVGREGGEEALRFFTEPKNVCIRLDEPQRGAQGAE
jgi:aminomuconate-semialdehyde/2-hydroxymuconate-6-semialdehyde dehydrogenase